jgi:hypothetical protein
MVDSTKPCMFCGSPGMAYWQYKWKGKTGSACEACGKRWYSIGGYLNDRAVEFIESLGIQVFQAKDKLGGWRIYHEIPKDEVKRDILKHFHAVYTDVFHEFSWEWSIRR